MARQWRIEYEGALYHVLSRGNEGRRIFGDDEDRTKFLEILGRMCQRYGTEIYAYVLMDNHYHLVLSTPGGNLSRSMQWLGGTYTRYFNLQRRRRGHLFQGRFKSFLIEDDSYLLRLSCYIHRNPLRAGIVDRLAGYRWSSYQAYAFGRQKKEWLKTDLILSLFHEKDIHAAYRKAAQSYAREKKSIWEEVRYGFLMGSDDFADTITSRFLSDRKHQKDIPEQKSILGRTSLNEIAAKAASVLNCDLQEFIISPRIKGSDRENRDLLLYILYDTGLYTNKEIGELFELTYSSVSRRVQFMQACLNADRKLKKRFEKVEKLWHRQ